MSDDVVTVSRRPIAGAPEVLPRDRIQAVQEACSKLVQTSQMQLGRIRSQLGQLRAQRERLEEQRIAFQRRERSAGPLYASLQNYYGLTAREAEVAMLLAAGASNAAISEALGISSHTARHHTQHVLAKLGVHTRAEAGARLRG